MSRCRRNKSNRRYPPVPQTNSLGLTGRAWGRANGVPNDRWAWDDTSRCFLLHRSDGWELMYWGGPSDPEPVVKTYRRWREVVAAVTTWRLTHGAH